MSSPAAGSSRPESLILIQRREETRQVPSARTEPWAKRLMTSAARRVKNNPLFFPTIVRAFRALQRLGINVTPNHFYWPVPDVEDLAKREWPIYAAPPGCNFRLRNRVALARHF